MLNLTSHASHATLPSTTPPPTAAVPSDESGSLVDFKNQKKTPHSLVYCDHEHCTLTVCMGRRNAVGLSVIHKPQRALKSLCEFDICSSAKSAVYGQTDVGKIWLKMARRPLPSDLRAPPDPPELAPLCRPCRLSYGHMGVWACDLPATAPHSDPKVQSDVVRGKMPVCFGVRISHWQPYRGACQTARSTFQMFFFHSFLDVASIASILTSLTTGARQLRTNPTPSRLHSLPPFLFFSPVSRLLGKGDDNQH
jgi:hypothetical protein